MTVSVRGSFLIEMASDRLMLTTSDRVATPAVCTCEEYWESLDFREDNNARKTDGVGRKTSLVRKIGERRAVGDQKWAVRSSVFFQTKSCDGKSIRERSDGE